MGCRMKTELDLKSGVQRVRGEFLQGFTEANVKNYQTVAPSGKGLPANRNMTEKHGREKGED